MPFRKKNYQIPEEHGELYLREQHSYNLRHIRNMTLIMVPISLVLLVQHLFVPEVSLVEFAGLYQLIFALIAGSGIFFLLVVRFALSGVSAGAGRIAVLAYLYILSFLLMALTYLDLHFGQELSSYIIILMFLSTMVWLSSSEFAWISTFVLALLGLCYLLLMPVIHIQLHHLVQAVIYYSLSWGLYLSISSVRIENFLNRITMEQQYLMLETESATDPLTGLYNRRYLKEEMLKELARSERSGVRFCILLMDIDHFKKVNDNYGHIAGDNVLRELAAILRNSVRLSDKVFRYGGEEFMVLLPETLASDAGILGDRIREKVENYSFTGIRKKITISGGIAQNSVDSSQELLIRKADKRLYRAKENGRNRVVWTD